MKRFYITTAIDYANGMPHLGHAYEKVLTDVVARYRRLRGDEVRFLTGLDEHGQKVQQSARAMGIEPQELCDRAAEAFQGLCRNLQISHDDFIRTTEERHKTVVCDLLQKLFAEGMIYKAEYKGFYSPRQEQFLQEKDKVDGVWPEIFGDVQEISESNYFFRLSQFQPWLIEHLQTHEDFIFPRFRAKQVLEFLKEPINDLCISRPKSRLSWGIPLPFDPEYVTYVWFDALLNYVSGAGYGTGEFEKNWPADFHVIGKDILVPPHAVYWPIMLHACGIEQPKSFLVHGWWLSSGKKMSKSSGVVINPLDLIEQFGADAFRYFVTREMNVGQDSEFTLDLFLTRYTSDLANDLGNLLNRILNMTHRYRDGILPLTGPGASQEKELAESWARTRDTVVEQFDGFQFHQALETIFQFIRSINRYTEHKAPWKLAKQEDAVAQADLDATLCHMAEGLRLSVLLLEPVMPGTTAKVLAMLGADQPNRWDGHLDWKQETVRRPVAPSGILFPKPPAAPAQE